MLTLYNLAAIEFIITFGSLARFFVNGQMIKSKDELIKRLVIGHFTGWLGAIYFFDYNITYNSVFVLSGIFAFLSSEISEKIKALQNIDEEIFKKIFFNRDKKD